ncbi:ribosomal protein S13 [Tanacetum coccineum]
MLYISGARSVADEQVRIASTKIDGIGPKKAILVRYRLGISGNIKIKELTKYQIDQIEQMIGQDHVVHWELKRGERADIERFISISCYRGIRHQDGSPLRGPRNSSEIVMAQKQIRSDIPLFPVLVMFFISCVAETNQAPFDLPKAKAESVAGYNVEYARDAILNC